MNLYAFELGRKKELSTAELISVLGEENLLEKNLDTVIFKLKDFAPQDLQDRLGGTIKIIEIFETLPNLDVKDKIKEHLEENFKDSSGKIPFSISILSIKNLRKINIKDLLNYSKKILKNLGLNSRFVNKNFKNTRPSTIFKAKVIQKGIDINIIQGNKEVFLGKTIAIQNINDYSKRDFDKPKRDMKVGMLPPKLSQILINLAGNPKTIYDPFCGTGTILMEGLLMGKDVVGSDISDRMVEYSKENTKWLESEFNTKNSCKIFEKDARFITKKDLPEKIDAVITEGYLGQALESAPNQKLQETIFRELANLHFNWLKAISQVTPKSCKIVMCVTAFRVANRIIHLPRFKEIAEENGYKIVNTFTYDRPDQFVARDIKILVRK